MRVVSLGGISNDGVNYDLWLERPYSQAALTLEQTPREGQDPVVSQARRNGLVMTLNCRIFGADEEESEALLEALLAELDTKEAAIALVVANSDGSNERYRTVVCSAVDEQAEGEGTGQYVAATLVTHEETRWRASTPKQITWDATASGQELVVGNEGSLAARPVYTFKPTAAKAGAGNAFLYRVFCAVKWTGWGVSWYPVDVAGGLLDTEALLGAGKIYAPYGQNNIGVMVDGRMRRRWVSQFDSATTKVWVNLDFDWRPGATRLAASVGSGDAISELEATEDISGFPTSGILQIDEEIFSYDGKDDVTRTFMNVIRGAEGSAAAGHVGGSGGSGAEIYLIQHDIWILYGGSGYWLNTYDPSGPDGFGFMGEDIYRPAFNLDNSGNLLWDFETFGESGDENVHRSASWTRGGAAEGTLTIGEPWDEIAVTQTGMIYGLTGYSYWSLRTAYRLGAMHIIGRGANYDPGSLWRVSMWNQGVEYLAIPEPEPGNIEFDLVDFELSVTGISAGYEEVRFEQRCGGPMECRLDRVRLFFDQGPGVMMAGEIAAYDLDLTLENLTTHQGIRLTLAMGLGETLEVDTERHTVRLVDDGSSQYQALARDSRRREILPLAAGNNTLKVIEAGLAGVRVHVAFEERRYS